MYFGSMLLRFVPHRGPVLAQSSLIRVPDLPATNTSASGTMKIVSTVHPIALAPYESRWSKWGSTDAITDITKAADWQILDCDPTALTQDIRLVCMNDPEDPDSSCGHLYQNIGAVNKLVRLPESVRASFHVFQSRLKYFIQCGASAFARIAKAWVPADQSIPGSIKSRIVRRDGSEPVVKALTIDTNFDAVDSSKCVAQFISLHS
jgi:hypothetical protein